MIALLFLAQTIFFSPNGGCTSEIVREISRAKQSVYVQAYSFTSQPIADVLIADKKRGLDVRVILDQSWLTGAGKIEPQLVASGIPVLIDARHAIAHNKIIIIDTALVLTGSFNFTNQAEHRNAENLVVIHRARLAQIYLANWQTHAAHSAAP